MDGRLNLSDIVALTKRRYLFVLVPALLIGVCAVLFAYLLPPTYEASATILVESQQIRPDLASTTVTANADERIQAIQQRLLTRDNLLEIAGKFDLYRFLGAERSPTAIVDNLRAAVEIARISTPRTTRQDTSVIGFTVKFKYRDAATAARVTNELVASILSQNIETRLSSASDTSSFFAQQATGLEKQLLETETKIADFKRVNEADLPETLAARRVQVTLLTDRIAELQQRIALTNAPGAATALGESSTNVEQLGYSLEGKKLELDGLRQQRDKIAPLAQKGFVAQNRLDDLDQQIALAELNIKSLTAQISAAGGLVGGEDALTVLKSQRDELTRQLASLNDSISRTPAVEVELNGLTRDYNSLQTEYVQVKAKLQEAATGEQLEQDRQAERFEVIEQASVPDQPSEPNRPRVALIGTVAGVLAGVGLAALFEMVYKRIYSARDLERHLGLRPIAVIPYVTTKSEIRYRRTRRVIAAATFAGAIALGVVAVHVYFMPLDVLLERGVGYVAKFASSRLGLQVPQA